MSENNVNSTEEIVLSVEMGDAVSAQTAEAYAVGKRGGVDVAETDPTWHNNAKYYAEQAEEAAGEAQGAEEAAQRAEAAQAAAEAAQAQAAGSAATAGQKAAAAAGSAQAAATAKTGAETAQSAAAGSATAAEGSAGRASQSATAAAGSATAAGTAKTAAETARDAAAGSATAAAGSASAADQSAQAAAASAQAAEDVAESIPADYSQLSDDVSGLKSAFEQLDANVITESAGPAPIVSIVDGADGMPMRSVEVAIEPVQDLHGYDAPWPAGGGKNLLNIYGDYITRSGISGIYTMQDEEITVLSSTTGAAYCGFIIPVQVGQSYVFSYASTGKAKIAQLDEPVSTISDQTTYGTDKASGSVITAEKPYFLVNFVASNTAVKYSKPMIEAGSTVTAYTPYSNICPITGWDAVKVTALGEDLTNSLQLASGYYNENGTIVAEPGMRRTENYIPCKGGQKFYFRETPNYGNSRIRVHEYSADKIWLRQIYISENTLPRNEVAIETFETSSDATFIRFSFPNYANNTLYFAERNVIVETQLGQTVYGGTLTVNNDGTGTLVVDHGFIDTQSNTWTLNAINDHGIANFKYYKSPLEFDFDADVITSALPYDSSSQANATKPGYSISGNSTLYVRLYSSEASTVAEFKQWASANGLQILLKLATPVTYQLTNQQVIETLKGVNNVLADAGNTSITYPADTKMYIDRKITEAVANALNA